LTEEACAKAQSRGVAMGEGVYGYLPSPPKKKICPSKLLWGKNDVRTVIEQFYTPCPPQKKTFIPPKQIPGYAPGTELNRWITIILRYAGKNNAVSLSLPDERRILLPRYLI